MRERSKKRCWAHWFRVGSKTRWLHIGDVKGEALFYPSSKLQWPYIKPLLSNVGGFISKDILYEGYMSARMLMIPGEKYVRAQALTLGYI